MSAWNLKKNPTILYILFRPHTNICMNFYSAWKTYHLHPQSEPCIWPNFSILLLLISSCSLVGVLVDSSLTDEDVTASGVKPTAPSLLSFLLDKPRADMLASTLWTAFHYYNKKTNFVFIHNKHHIRIHMIRREQTRYWSMPSFTVGSKACFKTQQQQGVYFNWKYQMQCLWFTILIALTFHLLHLQKQRCKLNNIRHTTLHIHMYFTKYTQY